MSFLGLTLSRTPARCPTPRVFADSVAYNLFPLKDTGYQPRFYDDRIGYFTEDYETFDEDVAPDNARRMIQRWHLVKKDPKAASRTRETDHLLDRQCDPPRYRDAIREGVLYWNAAFEPLGFKNAVQCEIMPDNADWDPADMSHNVVRWVSSPGAGYAVALFRHNPLTGRSSTRDQRGCQHGAVHQPGLPDDGPERRAGRTLPFPAWSLPGTAKALTPPQVATQIIHAKPDRCPANRCRCDMAQGAMQAAAFGWDAWRLVRATGPTDAAEPARVHAPVPAVDRQPRDGALPGPAPQLQRVHDAQHGALQDKAMTSQYGVTGSVMDYLPANVPPLNGKRADLWSPCVGPYDKWAIAYGYTDFGGDPVQERIGPGGHRRPLPRVRPCLCQR